MHAPFDLDPQQWQRLRALLDLALDRPADEHAAWLRGLGAPDAALVPRLQALLAHGQGGAFPETFPRFETDSFAPSPPMPER
ncbi:MAG: hypothetical protein ABIR94_10175, partial [Rubrivivax sp.]